MTAPAPYPPAQGPNLFVIGAAKCATSSLHGLLGGHPAVFMSPLKEPGYFADPDTGAVETRPFARPDGTTEHRPYRNARADYLALFAGAAGARYRGESSTRYSMGHRYPGTAGRIAAAAPDARVVYAVRDPVERTLSHYWWHVRHEGEARGPLAAVRDDPHYRETSHYAARVRPYLDRFGPGRVYVLTAEDLGADPAGTLAGMFAWLGLPPHAPPPRIGRANVTDDVVVRPRSGTLERVRFSKAYGLVSAAVPGPLRRAARRLNEDPVDRSAVDDGPARAYLRDIHAPQVSELEELLGRRFGGWPATRGAAP